MTKLQISLLLLICAVSTGLYALLSYWLAGTWNCVLAADFGVIVTLCVSGFQSFRPTA